MEKRILIIDDDADYSEAIGSVIKSKGYQVDTASDSETGLQKIQNDKPDLIILDVMMKTKDEGFNFARMLKKHGEYKNIPIIMLTAVRESTGFDFRSEVGDDKWLPVDDYCDKFVEKKDLLLKIEKLLQS